MAGPSSIPRAGRSASSPTSRSGSGSSSPRSPRSSSGSGASRKLGALPWDDVESLDGSLMSLKPGAEDRLAPVCVSNEEILLREDLLDKQVVDTFGAKIERVNDVHLLIVNRDLRTVHVDFGAAGHPPAAGLAQDGRPADGLALRLQPPGEDDLLEVRPAAGQRPQEEPQAQRHAPQAPGAPSVGPRRHHRGARPGQPVLGLQEPGPGNGRRDPPGGRSQAPALPDRDDLRGEDLRHPRGDGARRGDGHPGRPARGKEAEAHPDHGEALPADRRGRS